jgi:peptidoglycan/LPS O-acetylase OafA/YrhL
MFWHCWSLAMEEQFYLFWPTVEKYSSRLVCALIFAALLLINQGVNFGFFSGLISRVYGYREATELPIFKATFTPILLGVGLAYLLRNARAYSLMYRIVGARCSVFAWLAVLMAIAEAAPKQSLSGWPHLAIQLTMALILASLVVREDHYARPFLASAPMARLGVISYGLYLYHTWVIYLLRVAADRLGFGSIPRPMLFLFASAATIAVAEISFRLIEQPLLRIKKRYSH